MVNDIAIAPYRVSRSFVENKCGYFSDMQLWPREERLNPDAWLTNFNEDEMDHAVHLLGAFLYYSTDLISELFKGAFHKLSSQIIDLNGPPDKAQAAWDFFRKKVVITRVTGERPNDTDSGFMFARMSRQDLGLAEDQIMTNTEALECLSRDGTRPIVFVDDFAGSGDQFIATWEREAKIDNGAPTSFKVLAKVRGTRFFFCPVFIAEAGRSMIRRQCPEVILLPAHFIPANYSAVAPDSIVWPDHLRASSRNFLEVASKRAGLSDSEWMGYNFLGLTLAFEHGVPDATLPIFSHRQNGWKPLVRRT